MNHRYLPAILLLATAGVGVSMSRVAAQPAPAAARGFEAYAIVVKRNIFDARRRRDMPVGGPQAPAPDFLDLRGTLVQSGEPLAFFEGSGSDYRKALGVGADLAGLKVGDINTEKVTLLNGAEKISLPVGARLQKDEAGHWQVKQGGAVAPPGPVSSGSGTGSGASPGSSAPSPAISGSAADIMKRLQERRQRELGQ